MLWAPPPPHPLLAPCLYFLKRWKAGIPPDSGEGGGLELEADSLSTSNFSRGPMQSLCVRPNFCAARKTTYAVLPPVYFPSRCRCLFQRIHGDCQRQRKTKREKIHHLPLHSLPLPQTHGHGGDDLPPHGHGGDDHGRDGGGGGACGHLGADGSCRHPLPPLNSHVPPPPPALFRCLFRSLSPPLLFSLVPSLAALSLPSLSSPPLPMPAPHPSSLRLQPPSPSPSTSPPSPHAPPPLASSSSTPQPPSADIPLPSSDRWPV
mmetsp:Transcript_41641/g.82162  ORF Transcript_41641/g.82162 Transcript_41641/m.82162 type:complete len:262 (+) Transcript_41641:927-1712(+)